METPTFIESYQTEQYRLCDSIINRLEQVLGSRFNGNSADDNVDDSYIMIGSETNGSSVNRTDFSVDFSAIQEPLAVDMHTLLNQYIKLYAEKYVGFASQVCFSEKMKVQKTPPKGGFHTWHCEHVSHNNSAYRNLTWTLYLNDIPDGEGETEFLEYGVKVQPKKGLLCFFPASWTHIHRGNPVYSCDKYIATGWYYLT